MQRYFVQLNYKGTRYHGWQVQPNGISVQEVIEKSMSTLLGETLALTGAGRTDTGVHALFFMAHFDAGRTDLDDAGFLFRLNSFLPPDISVQRIIKMEPEAHARFSALSRTYQYVITRLKDPFLQETALFYPGALDVEKMNRAAGQLFDFNDFTSFTDAKDTNSTRPRRSNAGEIDIYSPPNFLSNKQGTKRTRTLLENVNINANCDYDDDSKCSDSTSEAEFQG